MRSSSRAVCVAIGVAVALTAAGSASADEPTIVVQPLPRAATENSPPIVYWNTGSGVPGEVWVSEEGAPERLFGTGRNGSQPASWLKQNRRFAFRLYTRDKASLLATLRLRPAAAPETRVVGRAGPTPRTPGYVDTALRGIPFLLWAAVLAVAGWFAYERIRTARV